MSAVNPSEELDSPGKAKGIIRLLPLDHTHALQGSAHASAAAAQILGLSRAESKLQTEEGDTRLGHTTGGRVKGLS